MFNLVSYTRDVRRSDLTDMTLEDMLEENRNPSSSFSVHREAGTALERNEAMNDRKENLILHKTNQCLTNCVCPPGLCKPENTRCGRCHNRGHTELVRSLALNRDTILSGSYDSTVKVSSSVQEDKQVDERAKVDKHRYGINQATCWQTYQEDIQAAYSRSWGIRRGSYRVDWIVRLLSGTWRRGWIRLLSSRSEECIPVSSLCLRLNQSISV